MKQSQSKKKPRSDCGGLWGDNWVPGCRPGGKGRSSGWFLSWQISRQERQIPLTGEPVAVTGRQEIWVQTTGEGEWSQCQGYYICMRPGPCSSSKLTLAHISKLSTLCNIKNGKKRKPGNTKCGAARRTSQKEAQLWQKYAWHKFPNNLVSHLLVLVLMLMRMLMALRRATPPKNHSRPTSTLSATSATHSRMLLWHLFAAK